MSLPSIEPSARTFTPGNFPVREYRALSGKEIRIRYGNVRTESTLDLTYENISDTDASLFLSHYNSLFGTFDTFTLGNAHLAFIGWTGTAGALTSAAGTTWRYAEPPQVESVYRGRSTVRVRLIAVA